MTPEEPSSEFYKKMYNAKTVCWCGGELETIKDGIWYINKCTVCGRVCFGYGVMVTGGYAQ